MSDELLSEFESFSREMDLQSDDSDWEYKLPDLSDPNEFLGGPNLVTAGTLNPYGFQGALDDLMGVDRFSPISDYWGAEGITYQGKQEPLNLDYSGGLDFSYAPPASIASLLGYSNVPAEQTQVADKSRPTRQTFADSLLTQITNATSFVKNIKDGITTLAGGVTSGEATIKSDSKAIQDKLKLLQTQIAGTRTLLGTGVSEGASGRVSPTTGQAVPAQRSIASYIPMVLIVVVIYILWAKHSA